LLLITKVLFAILYGDIGAMKPDSGSKDCEKSLEWRILKERILKRKMGRGRIEENYLRTVMCVISKR
jgi:hypothetical protein